MLTVFDPESQKTFDDMYAAGNTDEEIGNVLFCTRGTVYLHRKRLGLPANGRKAGFNRKYAKDIRLIDYLDTEVKGGHLN